MFRWFKKRGLSTDRLGRPLPQEYFAWFHEIFPFMKTSYEKLNKKELNQDSYHEIRILFAFYFLGIVKCYSERESLTYGQQRHLFIESVIRLGWNSDFVSRILDFSHNPSMHLPNMEDDILDAVDAGKRAARAYFEESDVRSYLMPNLKLMMWKQKYL